eukprot:Nk52_evm36s2496 gene=Nk52_evmTU36s2496
MIPSTSGDSLVQGSSSDAPSCSLSSKDCNATPRAVIVLLGQSVINVTDDTFFEKVLDYIREFIERECLCSCDGGGAGRKTVQGKGCSTSGLPFSTWEKLILGKMWRRCKVVEKYVRGIILSDGATKANSDVSFESASGEEDEMERIPISKVNAKMVAVCFKLIGVLWQVKGAVVESERVEGEEGGDIPFEIECKELYVKILGLVCLFANIGFKDSKNHYRMTERGGGNAWALVLSAQEEKEDYLCLDDLYTLQAAALKGVEMITCTESGIRWFWRNTEPKVLLRNALREANCFVVNNMMNVLLKFACNGVGELFQKHKREMGGVEVFQGMSKRRKVMPPSQALDMKYKSLLETLSGFKEHLVFRHSGEKNRIRECVFDRPVYKAKEAVKGLLKLLGELVVQLGPIMSSSTIDREFEDSMKGVVESAVFILVSCALFSPKGHNGEKGVAMGSLYHVNMRTPSSCLGEIYEKVCKRIVSQCFPANANAESCLPSSEYFRLAVVGREVPLLSTEHHCILMWSLLKVDVVPELFLQGIDLMTCVPDLALWNCSSEKSPDGERGLGTCKLMCLIMCAALQWIGKRSVCDHYSLSEESALGWYAKLTGSSVDCQFLRDVVGSLCALLNKERNFNFCLSVIKRVLVSSHVYIQGCPKTSLECGWLCILLNAFEMQSSNVLLRNTFGLQNLILMLVKNLSEVIMRGQGMVRSNALCNAFEKMHILLRVQSLPPNLLSAICGTMLQLIDVSVDDSLQMEAKARMGYEVIEALQAKCIDARPEARECVAKAMCDTFEMIGVLGECINNKLEGDSLGEEVFKSLGYLIKDIDVNVRAGAADCMASFWKFQVLAAGERFKDQMANVKSRSYQWFAGVFKTLKESFVSDKDGYVREHSALAIVRVLKHVPCDIRSVLLFKPLSFLKAQRNAYLEQISKDVGESCVMLFKQMACDYNMGVRVASINAAEDCFEDVNLDNSSGNGCDIKMSTNKNCVLESYRNASVVYICQTMFMLLHEDENREVRQKCGKLLLKLHMEYLEAHKDATLAQRSPFIKPRCKCLFDGSELELKLSKESPEDWEFFKLSRTSLGKILEEAVVENEPEKYYDNNPLNIFVVDYGGDAEDKDCY